MNKIRLFMMAMVALVFAACQESNGDYRDVVYITGHHAEEYHTQGL